MSSLDILAYPMVASEEEREPDTERDDMQIEFNCDDRHIELEWQYSRQQIMTLMQWGPKDSSCFVEGRLAARCIGLCDTDILNDIFNWLRLGDGRPGWLDEENKA